MAEVARQKSGGCGGFDLADLVMPESVIEGMPKTIPTPKDSKRPKQRPFIKGPIDLEWMQEACKANAAPMALYLQYKQGILGKGARIQIRPSECREFGMNDRARQRQIDSLAAAGLILADKGNGRCPVVEVVGLYRG